MLVRYELRNPKNLEERVKAPSTLANFLESSTQPGYTSYVYPLSESIIHYVFNYFPLELGAIPFITNSDSHPGMYWLVVSLPKKNKNRFLAWVKFSPFRCFDLSQN